MNLCIPDGVKMKVMMGKLKSWLKGKPMLNNALSHDAGATIEHFMKLEFKSNT